MNSSLRKLDEREIAIHIIYFTSDENDYMGETVDEYCKSDQRLLDYRAKMLDELKWVAYACGLMVVIVRSPDIIANVIEQLVSVSNEIDNHNKGSTPFSMANLKHGHPMMLKYLKAFMEAFAAEEEYIPQAVLNMGEVYSREVFGGAPKSGTIIDKYTHEVNYYFLKKFNDRFKDFAFVK